MDVAHEHETKYQYFLTCQVHVAKMSSIANDDIFVRGNSQAEILNWEIKKAMPLLGVNSIVNAVQF